ncbi:MAG: Fe-S-binding domain-containing protein, partial [Actinobacteria bacterium]|nr:Fe-S-binding domain-containing protein [Actinomycetota bacterium]
GGLACLSQLLLAALIGVALTADSINLFVWYQVAALASFGLTGFFLERPIALEAAFKMVVLTTIGGFAVFIGAAMLYSRTGALNLGQLHDALSGRALNSAELVALTLLLAGFATKAGIVPFHAWLPDAHTPVPGAVSALFSALMVDLGVVAIARIALDVVSSRAHVLGLLTGLGVVSALLGAGLALVQSDLKRLLAWDTVSQMGVLLIGFGSADTDGVAGAVYHLVNHGLFKALLFLCAGAVVHATGKTELAEMGGLARARPLLTFGFSIGVLAISGLPPLNGYASLGLIHKGVEHHPFVLVLALLAQALTVAALGRAAYLAFFRHREPYEHLEPQRAGMRTSVLAIGFGCVAFGALPSVFLDHIAGPAAAALLHPAEYANAALGRASALSPVTVHFDYVDPLGITLTALELLAGIGLAYAAIRRPRLLAPLRHLGRLHTGSVNDYAAFSVAGLVIVALALLI